MEHPHAAQDRAEYAALDRVTEKPAKSRRNAAKIGWVFALLGGALGGATGVVGINEAASAPQQAAAAAMGCFYIIGPYVIARAVDELTR